MFTVLILKTRRKEKAYEKLGTIRVYEQTREPVRHTR